MTLNITTLPLCQVSRFIIIMLSVVMLNVIMLSVVAPQNDKALLKYIFDKNKHTGNKRVSKVTFVSR